MESDGGASMDAVPEGVLQHILSMLTNVRDVAACACVCHRWRDCVPYLPALFFPRNAFDAAAAARGAADDAIGRMVGAVERLRELVIYCPFSMARLPDWLAARSATLRVLELRMDAAAADKAAPDDGHLDCIGLAPNLEEIRLWGVLLTTAPAWGRMEQLRVLEVVGAPMRDSAVKEAIAACPNLTDLSLLGCECSGTVVIELALLKRCRLDFFCANNCSILLTAPRMESLEVQGFAWMTLRGGHSLRRLSIAKSTGAPRITNSVFQFHFTFIIQFMLFQCNDFQFRVEMMQGRCTTWTLGIYQIWTTFRCAASSGAGPR